MSLQGLPYEIYYLLLTHVCTLGDPPSLLAFLLSHRPLHIIFSENEHAFIPLLAQSLPRSRYELALGLYNLKLWAQDEHAQAPDLFRCMLSEDPRVLISEFFLRPPTMSNAHRIILRTDAAAHTQVPSGATRPGPAAAVALYFSWYKEQMSLKKNPPMMAYVREWTTRRSYRLLGVEEELEE